MISGGGGVAPIIPCLLFRLFLSVIMLSYFIQVVLLDFSLTVKAAPHECVIRTSQP